MILALGNSGDVPFLPAFLPVRCRYLIHQPCIEFFKCRQSFVGPHNFLNLDLSSFLFEPQSLLRREGHGAKGTVPFSPSALFGFPALKFVQMLARQLEIFLNLVFLVKAFLVDIGANLGAVNGHSFESN